jgi:acyl carrier protein
MQREEVKAGLIGLLTTTEFGSLQIDVSEIDEETSLLNDAALDSVQLLEFIVAMERAFGFRVNTKRLKIDVFDRFGDVVDFVHAAVLGTAADSGRSGDARYSA